MCKRDHHETKIRWLKVEAFKLDKMMKYNNCMTVRDS